MTCVVAIATEGRLVMGADSAAVGGSSLFVRDDPKLFHRGPFLIGFTTSYRMGQILRYRLDPRGRHADEDAYDYMATAVIDSARQVLASGGFRKRENEVEEGGTFLVAYEGHVFRIDDDFQVGEHALPYDAVGSGQPAALGSLHGTDGIIEDPRVRVMRALEAAEQFTASVRRPFQLLELGVAPS